MLQWEKLAQTVYATWQEYYYRTHHNYIEHHHNEWVEHKIRQDLVEFTGEDSKFILRYIAVHHLPPLIACDLIEEFNLHGT